MLSSTFCLVMQNLILVPKTCHVYHLKGATESGIYKIDPDGAGHLPLIEAYCELQNSKCIFLSCRKIRIVLFLRNHLGMHINYSVLFHLCRYYSHRSQFIGRYHHTQVRRIGLFYKVSKLSSWRKSIKSLNWYFFGMLSRD